MRVAQFVLDATRERKFVTMAEQAYPVETSSSRHKQGGAWHDHISKRFQVDTKLKKLNSHAPRKVLSEQGAESFALVAQSAPTGVSSALRVRAINYPGR